MGGACCAQPEPAAAKNDVFDTGVADSLMVESAVAKAPPDSSTPAKEPEPLSPASIRTEEKKEEPLSPSSMQVAAPTEEKIGNSEPQTGTQKQYFERFLAGRPNQPDKPGSMPRKPESVGISFDAFVEKKASLCKILRDMDTDVGWTQCKDAELNTQIFMKQNAHDDLVSFKARTTITLPPGGVLRDLIEMMDPSLRPQWDERCIEGKVIQAFNPFYRISYFAIQPPVAVIAKRDTCMTGHFSFEEDGTLWIFTEHSDAVPEREGFVRVGWKGGGYIVRPATENPTTSYTITFCGCADPGGWIPTFVKKIIAPKQGEALANFKKAYEAGTLKAA